MSGSGIAGASRQKEAAYVAAVRPSQRPPGVIGFPDGADGKSAPPRLVAAAGGDRANSGGAPSPQPQQHFGSGTSLTTHNTAFLAQSLGQQEVEVYAPASQHLAGVSAYSRQSTSIQAASQYHAEGVTSFPRLASGHTLDLTL